MVQKLNIMSANKILFNWIILISLGLSMNNCADSSIPNNDILGELPALSDTYQNNIDMFKKKSKEATNINDAFKYEKKYLLTKEESDIALLTYVEQNLLNSPIPFEMYDNDVYEIIAVVITGAQRFRLNIKGSVLIKKDLINNYGGFKQFFFTYIKAVDNEGIMIDEPCIMSAIMSGNPFMAGARIPISGSIGNLRHFSSFKKIVFITKEEYDALK